MGNSLRHSLGHMCGGQATKDLPEDEDGKPVDKTKESKKKSKKNKKHKKVRNGKLSSIKEEIEVQDELQPNGNRELPTGEGDGKSKEDINPDESQKHEDIHEEESQEYKFLKASVKDELHINDEALNVPEITIECPSETFSGEEDDEKALDEVSSDIPISDSCLNNEETVIDGKVQDNNEGDNISLLSSAEEEPSIIVCSFKPIKIETLGIEAADEIFNNAFINYELYVKGGIKFQDTVLEFQKSVEREKKSIDFLTLWHVYKALAEESMNKDSEDIIDLSSDLKAMESAGLELIQIIENVKPILNKCSDDANNIDAIECVKDQMLGEEELMSTDKFSALGKYRRNMSRLKKCIKQIIETELETNEILCCLQVYFDEQHNETLQAIDSVSLARESIIIPEEKNTNQDLEDLFSNFSQESIPIVMSDFDEEPLNEDHEDHEERPSTPLPTDDVQVSPDDVNYVPNDSHSDHDEDEVFLDVQCESDDNCLDSIQVSREISNCMGLDFDIISHDIQAIDSAEKDNIEEASELHTLPQVHSDIGHDKQSMCELTEIIDIHEEIIIVEDSQVELECVPDMVLHDIPGSDDTPVESNILECDQFAESNSPDAENKSSDSSNSLSSKSYNSLTVELDLDCSPDSEVSSVNIEYQSPPLSEDIIGPSETDDDITFANVERENSTSDHYDDFEQSYEDCNGYSEHDLGIIDRTQSSLGNANQSNYEEILSASVELSEVARSLELVVEDEREISYEKVRIESSSHTPLLDPELENTNNSTSSSIENVEPCDTYSSNEQTNTDSSNEQTNTDSFNEYTNTDDGDTDAIRKVISPTRIDSAIESDNLDISDYIEYNESTPLTKTVPSTPYCLPDKNESGIVISDTEYEKDELIQVTEIELNNYNKDKGSKQLSFSDSCEEIITGKEIKKGQDVTVISCNGKSTHNPMANISYLTFEEIHNNISDSECNSDTTSIQEIHIFPSSKSVDNSFKTSEKNIPEKPILHSEHCLSDKEVNDTSTEVDVALKVLEVAIKNDDVQDEYVDLLCSSISRVLGDEDEKPPISRFKSIESSHSSYEESSIHKSFQLSKEVIDWVGTHFQSDESIIHDNDKKDFDEIEQCIIVPVEKGSVHSPHIISHTILKSEKHPMKNGDLVRTVNVSVEDITADEGIDDAMEDEQSHTFVIKSVPETTESNNILSPLGSPPLRCFTPPHELDMEPDHNTLDYGNYVFIDPSTGDIQVMRNRSRSLDSLVSMTSSRSSISRFGSFEFVTDFEINIAEKNQELMKSH